MHAFNCRTTIPDQAFREVIHCADRMTHEERATLRKGLVRRGELLRSGGRACCKFRSEPGKVTASVV